MGARGGICQVLREEGEQALRDDPDPEKSSCGHLRSVDSYRDDRIFMGPPPGAYPPPNGNGPRPSLPPTPVPAHAHQYPYHQSPQSM